MDEILASIRRMIADEDGSVGAVRAAPAEAAPANNVSRLFAGEARPAEMDGPSPQAADNVIELAITQAMEDARVEVAAEAAVEAAVSAPAAPAEEPAPTGGTAVAAAEGQSGAEGPEPLLSPQSDVAIAGAFNRLAATMLARSARTVDDLVEDLLRPMLRNWLDANLPPLVERLVREEIERVARGRR